MKLATIALFVAVIMGLALGTSSLFTSNMGVIDTLLSVIVPGRTPSPEPARAPAQVQALQPGQQIIPVPSGTFQGPTGQPSIQGPSGPPPQAQ